MLLPLYLLTGVVTGVAASRLGTPNPDAAAMWPQPQQDVFSRQPLHNGAAHQHPMRVPQFVSRGFEAVHRPASKLPADVPTFADLTMDDIFPLPGKAQAYWWA